MSAAKNSVHPLVVCCICDRPIRGEHPTKHPYAGTSKHLAYTHRDCYEQEREYCDDMLAGSELAP
jgi:hypothetical protein